MEPFKSYSLTTLSECPVVLTNGSSEMDGTQRWLSPLTKAPQEMHLIQAEGTATAIARIKDQIAIPQTQRALGSAVPASMQRVGAPSSRWLRTAVVQLEHQRRQCDLQRPGGSIRGDERSSWPSAWQQASTGRPVARGTSRIAAVTQSSVEQRAPVAPVLPGTDTDVIVRFLQPPSAPFAPSQHRCAKRRNSRSRTLTHSR